MRERREKVKERVFREKISGETRFSPAWKAENIRQLAAEGVGDVAARRAGTDDGDVDGGLAHAFSPASPVFEPLKRCWK